MKFFYPLFFNLLSLLMINQLRAQFPDYWRLMRFDRPIGALLLLWPTLWGLWIAVRGLPNLFILLIFILGVILMRAAGCVINDFADRNFDRHVERTKKRPLTTGRVSVKEAIILFIVLCLLAFALVLFLNVLTIALAMIGVVLATFYPFMKRYTHLPQVVLGIAFSWGVPMAFAAQVDTVPVIAWILFSAVICWTVAYDTEYAMSDRSDDIKIGIKSTAILLGRFDRWVIGLLQILMLCILATVGMVLQLTIWFYFSLLIAAGLMAYQQVLIRARDPTLCFRAFLNNNWVGFVIFVGIVLGVYH